MLYRRQLTPRAWTHVPASRTQERKRKEGRKKARRSREAMERDFLSRPSLLPLPPFPLLSTVRRWLFRGSLWDGSRIAHCSDIRLPGTRFPAECMQLIVQPIELLFSIFFFNPCVTYELCRIRWYFPRVLLAVSSSLLMIPAWSAIYYTLSRPHETSTTKLRTECILFLSGVSDVLYWFFAQDSRV